MDLLDDYYKFSNEELKKIDLKDIYTKVKEENIFYPSLFEDALFLTYHKIYAKHNDRFAPKLAMITSFIGMIRDKEYQPNKYELLHIIAQTSALNEEIERNISPKFHFYN